MILTLTDAQRLRLASSLPEGYSPDNLRFITASAQVLQAETLSPVEVAMATRLAAHIDQAKVPVVTDGRPTIMRVVAWMAHEGVNRNRLAFRRADLEAAAAMIAPPNLLPMDFNHSAVDDWAWDEKVIGAWYKGEFALDPAVNKYGILATGMMWSWAFPRYADKLLAEQGRHQKIDFSMACIAASVTDDADDDGPFEWGEKPTFLTLSALDVAPGDGAANGLAVEGDTGASVDEDLATQLKDPTRRPPVHSFVRKPAGSGAAARAASAAHDEFDPVTVLAALQSQAQTPSQPPAPATAAVPTEDATMDELLAFLRDNATKLANQEAVDAMGDKLNTIIAALESHEASATELARLTARVAELEGQLAERDTALTAATTEVTAANATITELNAAVTERDTALATYREVEAAAAVAATLQARIAELPAAYLAAHNALPDARRLEIETRWAAKTDEEWKEVLETASIVPTVQRSYLRRSAEEGTLPVGGAGSTNGASRLKRFLGR